MVKVLDSGLVFFWIRNLLCVCVCKGNKEEEEERGFGGKEKRNGVKGLLLLVFYECFFFGVLGKFGRGKGRV